MANEQFRPGTSFGDPFAGNIDDYLKNPAGDWVYVRCTNANIPTGAAGYAVGCDLRTKDLGTAYTNTGTNLSAVWTQLAAGGGGGGLSIPFSETDSISTTGTSIGDSATALTTGNVFQGTVATGVFTTGGAVFRASMNAVTAGSGFIATTTGAYTGIGLLVLTANSATTGTIAAISATSLTSGSGLTITAGGANLTTGNLLSLQMGAAVTGQAITSTNTGVYTDTAGIIALTANSLTTGSMLVQSATGQTSGILHSITGGGANLTTGICRFK